MLDLSFKSKLISLQRIVPNLEDLKKISNEKVHEIEQNMQKIDAVDFTYSVNNRIYNGFYAKMSSLKEKTRPVIIVHRGGYEMFGYVDADRIYTGYIACLIKSGYIVIGSQCMGTGDNGALDDYGGSDLESFLKLKEFIDNDIYADSSRIALYGISRGGISVFQMIRKVDWVKSVVTVSPLVDLRDDTFRPEMKNVIQRAFGGSQKDRIIRSAICHVLDFPCNIPILLLYGALDKRVDPRTGLDFSKKMLACKIPHRLVLFEGAGHSLKECRSEAQAMMLDWFEKYL